MFDVSFILFLKQNILKYTIAVNRMPEPCGAYYLFHYRVIDRVLNCSEKKFLLSSTFYFIVLNHLREALHLVLVFHNLQ